MQNNNTNQRVDEFGEEIKRQFEKIGSELKDQVLKDFNKVLSNDISELKNIVNNIVQEQSRNVLQQSQSNLQNALKQQFGDSVLGAVLGDTVLPGLFSAARGGIRSSQFKASAAQGILEVGRAIANTSSRNG